MPKKVQPPGGYWHLKVSRLKVNVCFVASNLKIILTGGMSHQRYSVEGTYLNT
jgi:hypothetical protein